MLTVDQILALSPDDSSSKAAKGLLAPAKWPTLGYTEEAIWGECQGSGSKPYQAIIDASGPSFKCSCPSRKFPCKHGLALYLLRAQKESSFTAGNPPAWVAEWLTSRRDRAEKQAEKKAAAVEKAATPVDPEAAAKREAKRLERMASGASDLERWMGDLVKNGMADLPTKPTSFWREAAARLVDAQAPGLANGVRLMESAAASGEGWPQRTLLQMGRLQLLSEALQRFALLPTPLQHEVRSAAGWPLEKEEVLATGERVEDTWQVQGISHEENDRLWERRVWLRGVQTQRQALLLDFSHGQRRYEQTYVSGSFIKAALVFFPSAFPLRALLPEAAQTVPAESVEDETVTWDDVLNSVAEALGQSPWLQRLPLHLGDATPVYRDSRWYARDAAGCEAPLRVSDEDGWELLAISGGHPLSLFGEWLGDRLKPLTAWNQAAVTPCWTEAVSA